MEGKIKKLHTKGFGFITGVEGREKDLFFHAAGLVKGLEFNSLKEGDAVSFEGIEPTAKGEQAFGVDVII